MMTLRELVKAARLEFWKDYHEAIEQKGYSLGKDALLQGPDGFSIVTSISPGYSETMRDEFREILPKEYMYDGISFPVILSPSLSDLFQASRMLKEIYWIEERGYFTEEPIEKLRVEPKPIGSPISVIKIPYLEDILEKERPVNANAFCRSENFDSDIVSVQYYKL